MAKPELEFFDPSDIPSEPIPPVDGLSQQILSRDEVTGDYTRLLRFEPGTDTSAMGPQVHDFWEEVIILEGSLIDTRLNQEFTKGMYGCRPPGMVHGPYKSPNGCITFECRYYDKK